MLSFDLNTDRIIEEFRSKVQMSFQMNLEFRQICTFLLVNGCDVSYFLNSFLEKNVPEGALIRKNDAKKLLAKLRAEAIRSTPVKRRETQAYAAKQAFGNEKGEKKRITAWVEEDIKDDPRAKTLAEFADEIVYIHHYKDVFNSGEHDFKTEKKSGNFIIAKNREKLVYPGAPFCQSFGNEHFYYASCVKNCIFDCDYCFLQGLYPCGYPVYFINLEDYFKELDELLKEFPVYLCISYDTDLLAMEQRLHYVEKWIVYAQSNPDLKIEIRTKSGNSAPFLKFKQLLNARGAENCKNVVFAWTISPKEVVSLAESGLPDVEKRLDALMAAKKAGFPVRLCFDPMIFHENWKNSYSELFKSVFNYIKAEDIEDVSVGVFRIANNLLKRMRNANETSPITQFPYVTENGACHYGDLSREMVDFAVEELKKYMPAEKIYAWEGNE